MNLTELSGHFAFALIALSYLLRDILWLRAVSIVASIAAIAYNFYAPQSPLWLVIYWNVAFIALNAIHLSILLRERRSVAFTDEEKEMFETMFHGFSPVEFMRLLRVGRWMDAAPGTAIVREGELNENMMLLYSGSATVSAAREEVAQLRPGSYIGEMSFITGEPARATVKANDRVRYYAWPKDELEKLLERNPQMNTAFQNEMNLDLAKKLAKS